MAKNKEFLKLMIEKDLTQARLADKLGVNERTVYYWASGRNRPSMVHVIAMAKLFDMSIESVYAIFKEQ